MVRLNGRNLTSRIIDPADGRIPPLTGAAQDRVNAVQNARREQSADGPEDRTRPERCLSPTPLAFEPAGGGTNNFVQVVQTLDHLALLAELMGVAANHPHQHGETSPLGQFDRPLGIHGRDGKAIRWSLIQPITPAGSISTFSALITIYISWNASGFVDANTLLQEVTVDDPTAFTKPWTAVLPMFRTSARLFEFACHEGNYALKNILAGARADEAERSQGPK